MDRSSPTEHIISDSDDARPEASDTSVITIVDRSPSTEPVASIPTSTLPEAQDPATTTSLYYANSGYWNKTVKELRALLQKRKIQHKDLQVKAQLVVTLVHDNDGSHAKGHVRVSKRKAEELCGSYEKRARLKRESLPEYVALLAKVKACGLEITNTTQSALEQALAAHNRRLKEARDREQRLAYIAKTKSEVWPVFFQRTFQADHNREPFISLPRELRDTIYRLVFNDLILTEHAMKLLYDEDWDRFYSTGHGFPGVRTLRVLGSMNKLIRKEARATFWSLAKFDLRPRGISHDKAHYIHCEYDYYSIFERFLRGLGDDGRFGVRSLPVLGSGACYLYGQTPLESTPAAYATFTNTLSLISECSSLTTLAIKINEINVFWNDQTGLEAFFLQGHTLASEGISALQKALKALPHLLNADIGIPNPLVDQCEPNELIRRTSFPQYAFTGIRRVKLWMTAKQKLQATVLQSAHGPVHIALYKYQYAAIATQFKRDNPNASVSDLQTWTPSECGIHSKDYEAWLDRKARGIMDGSLSDSIDSEFDEED